jgi:hypothetical protein
MLITMRTKQRRDLLVRLGFSRLACSSNDRPLIVPMCFSFEAITGTVSRPWGRRFCGCVRTRWSALRQMRFTHMTIGRAEAIAHRQCRLIRLILPPGVRYEERGPAVTKESEQRRTGTMIRQLAGSSNQPSTSADFRPWLIEPTTSVGHSSSYRQSNCFLVGFGFAFNRIDVEPIFQQSRVVCLIHWRRDRSWRSACRIQRPK